MTRLRKRENTSRPAPWKAFIASMQNSRPHGIVMLPQSNSNADKGTGHG
jgi:hypothetical protein